MDAEARHEARIRAGILVGSYQVIALAVDNPELVPRITDVSHRWPWVGRAIASWCVVHLAVPQFWPAVCRLVRLASRRIRHAA